jgi:hypothetical protein
MTDATYVTKVHGEGPDKLTIEDGGTLEIVSGATISSAADVAITGATTLANTTLSASTTLSVNGNILLNAPSTLKEADTMGFYGGNQFYRVAAVHVDTTVKGLTMAQHTTGVFIPDKAIVTKAWVRVITQPTSTLSNSTLSIDLNAANDVVNGIVITNAQWTTGIKATIMAGAAANMLVMTAKREIKYTVGLEAILGGVFDVYVEYMPGN